MTVTNKDVYPSATQDGQAVPIDIAEPIGAIPIIFTNSSTPLIDIPEDTELMMCTTDKSCWVAFDKAVPAMVDAVYVPNISIILGNTAAYIRIPVGTTQIAVMSYTEDSGNLIVQFLRVWKALKQQTYAE